MNRASEERVVARPVFVLPTPAWLGVGPALRFPYALVQGADGGYRGIFVDRAEPLPAVVRGWVALHRRSINARICWQMEREVAAWEAEHGRDRPSAGASGAGTSLAAGQNDGTGEPGAGGEPGDLPEEAGRDSGVGVPAGGLVGADDHGPDDPAGSAAES